MSIDLTTHAGYDENKAKFDGAVTAARAASDELAAAKAEAEWERSQRTMFGDLVTAQQATAARDLALSRAKAQYPGIPEALYASFADPEQIEAAAKQAFDFAESLKGPGASNPQAQQQAKPAASQWTPSPGQGTPPPPAPDNPLDDRNVYESTLAEARTDVRNKAAREKIVEYGLAEVFGATQRNLALNRVHGDRPRNVEY